MKVGYARTSSLSQVGGLESQIKKLEEYGLTFKSEIFKSVWEFDSMEAGYEKTKKFLEANEWLFNLTRKELHTLYVTAYSELHHNKRTLLKNFSINGELPFPHQI